MFDQGINGLFCHNLGRLPPLTEARKAGNTTFKLGQEEEKRPPSVGGGVMKTLNIGFSAEVISNFPYGFVSLPSGNMGWEVGNGGDTADRLQRSTFNQRDRCDPGTRSYIDVDLPAAPGIPAPPLEVALNGDPHLGKGGSEDVREIVVRRTPRDMGPAFQDQPGLVLRETERRKKALEKKCDRSRAPLSTSNLKEIIPSLTFARLKVDPFRADLSAGKHGLRDLTKSDHARKMLGSQPGLLPSRPDVVDGQRSPPDDGEGKAGPQDLSATFTVRTIDLDPLFTLSHKTFLIKRRRVGQASTKEWDEVNLTFCLVVLAYSQSSKEGVKWKS